MPSRDVSIRITLKDGEVVRRALMALGEDGQKALAKIEKQSQPASRGLLAVNAVTGELRAGMAGYASALGPVGAGMMALGTGGLVAAGAIGGLAYALKQSMRAAREAVGHFDALQQKADQLGVGVEALQEYRYAFGQVGVNADVLDMALQRLGRRVGEIANFGKGEAKDALDQMGISVRSASGHVKTLDELLPEVADGLAKVTDQNRRMSLAQKLFDSEGVAMVRLLQQGADAFNRLRVEAREMGAVMDGQVVKNAAETNRKLEAMRVIIDTQMNGALVALSPLLLDFAEAWAEVAKWIGAVADNWAKVENRTSAGLQRRLEEIDKALKTGNFRQDDITDPFGSWTGAPTQSQLQQERDAIAAELARRKAEADAASRSSTATGEWSKDVQDRVRDLQAERDGLRALAGANELDALAVRKVTAANQADAELRKLKIDKDSEEGQAIAGLVKGNAELAHSIDVLAQARAMDPQKVYAERMRELDEIRKTGLADEQMIVAEEEAAERRRLAAHQDAASGIKRALMDIRAESRNAAQQWETDVKSMSASAKDSFVDIMTGAKSLGDGLQGLLNSIERNFMGRIFDNTLGLLIDSWMKGMMGGFGSFHSGGRVGAPGAQRVVSPLAFIGAPRMHEGGLMPGERPIIALDSERVLTAAQQDSTARTIQGLAAMANARPGVKIEVNNLAGNVAKASASSSWGKGGELRVDVLVEEIETRMARNVAKGEGVAPVMERRYGLNPAAGAWR